MAFIDEKTALNRCQETELLRRRMKRSAPVVDESQAVQRSDSPVMRDALPVGLDTRNFTELGVPRQAEVRSLEEKAIIGVTARIVSPPVAAAAFGISESYARALSRGEVNTNTERARILKEKIESLEEKEIRRIKARARHKLDKSLNLINKKTLENIPDKEKAKTASQIAKDMAAIVDRLTPKQTDINIDNTKETTVHVFTPEMAQESEYRVIELRRQLTDGEEVYVPEREQA